jgi:hypothetical protein
MDKRPKFGGRKAGTLNKTTAVLKDAILMAAENAGGKDGLVGYLQAQAKATPGPFMALLGKVLPTQLSGPDGGPIQTQDMTTDDMRVKAMAVFLAKTGGGK